MASIVHSTIRNEVINHILFKYGGKTHYISAILSALEKLLHNTYKKYDFPKVINYVEDSLTFEDNFQLNLSKINEKGARRKSSGVYYTDHDVTDFMVLNAFNHFLTPSLCFVLDTNAIDNNLQNLDTLTKDSILTASVLLQWESHGCRFHNWNRFAAKHPDTWQLFSVSNHDLPVNPGAFHVILSWCYVSPISADCDDLKMVLLS